MARTQDPYAYLPPSPSSHHVCLTACPPAAAAPSSNFPDVLFAQKEGQLVRARPAETAGRTQGGKRDAKRVLTILYVRGMQAVRCIGQGSRMAGVVRAAHSLVGQQQRIRAHTQSESSSPLSAALRTLSRNKAPALWRGSPWASDRPTARTVRWLEPLMRAASTPAQRQTPEEKGRGG